MRALLADNDIAMLDAVRRTIGTDLRIKLHFARSKQECIELLRKHRFEVLIACERLIDGSGLELLGQVVRHSPETLRIFSAEPERLTLLLGGRLAPFRLYQTLAYPIEAEVLLPLLVQIRAHCLESVLPRSPLKSRLGAAVRAPAEPPLGPQVPVRSAEETVTTVSETANPEPTPQPPRWRNLFKHRRLLIGAALPVSALLILLAVGQGNALRESFVDRRIASVGVSNAADAATNWNEPAVGAVVSEVELALARGDARRARLALAKLHKVAPNHPRIGFFERELAGSPAVY